VRTIILDGYNVILRSPAFRPDERRDLAQARERVGLEQRQREQHEPEAVAELARQRRVERAQVERDHRVDLAVDAAVREQPATQAAGDG